MSQIKLKNLVECLLEAANTDKGITFVHSGNEEEFVPYSQLYHQAYQICLHLRSKGVKKNSEVVFQFSSAKAFILSFWACIMGGYIAVPIAPISNEYTRSKLFSIWKKLNNPYLIFDRRDFLPLVKKDIDSLQNIASLNDIEVFDSMMPRAIDYDTINIGPGLCNEDFTPDEGIAYIQFSSGSTGNPKGVIVTHSNVLVNVGDMRSGLGLTPEDSFITWKPLTHDFSLVMFHICPLILGANQCIIPTNAYIRSPLLWFDKVNRHRSSVLGSPPFGIQHVLKFMKNKQRNKDWDLSCIKLLTTGAEQISYDLCREFCSKMEKYNINKNVFVPLYGLAEATLILTHGGVDESLVVHGLDRRHLSIGKKVKFSGDRGSKDSIDFVEVGRKLGNVEIKITDGWGQALKDLEVGHIKARGENISEGYYNDKEATDEVFSSDGWLDTGDLGFMINDRLVMVGRAKEIVTVGGINYTCNDIEQTICRHMDKDGLNKYVACNGFNNQTRREQAIVFVYYKKSLKGFVEIARNIKNIIFEKIGLVIDEVIPLNKIPKTTSGKIRRIELSKRYNNGEFDCVIKELREEASAKGRGDSNSIVFKDSVTSYVAEIIKDILDIPVNNYNQPFSDMGMVSANIPLFISKIEEDYNIRLDVASVFDYPNINRFADYLYNSLKERQSPGEASGGNSLKQAQAPDSGGIAIVGASCRFPGGANNPHAFWDLLEGGRFGISEVPEERWDSDKYYDADAKIPGKMYTKKGGFLNTSVRHFDSQFFNISPKEALSLDPQQRLVLELVWEAFESDGQNISDYFGTNTGVYIGISGEEYSLGHRSSGDPTTIDAYSLTGTTFSTCCGRVSYTFGFEGPSLCVDTACSSSLTALHIACRDLKSGDTDAAVVAGVNLILSPFVHICFSKLQAISPDGCSKTFDASANGYGRGEGAGAFVLKRLEDAIRDRDTILGVIRGTAINQDGKSNGLTAPSGLAQQKVIRKALKDAGLNALDINYIETHGTGTPLGDPIEVKALMEVYGQNRSKAEPLKIGSVKSNIGHLEASAGIASILKVLLSFKHGMIPGNLNFNTPNPYIPWDTSPVKVVAENTPWVNNGKPRRVGLNGFGFGGSNAHIIMEEAPGMEYTGSRESMEGFGRILKISAKTKDSLLQHIRNYSGHIENHTEENLDDIIYTADVTRNDFDLRFSVVANTGKELVRKMQGYLEGNREEGVFTNMDSDGAALGGKPRIVFMFSGQGSQYAGMGRELYNCHPVFRQAFDECSRMFRPYILKSLTELIYSEDASNEQVAKTVYAQPLIFSIEYSLCKLWEHMGVTPDIVLGHSIGEYAAAVAAKIVGLEDAVKLVAARGRLMDSAPGDGAMGAVFSDMDTVVSLIKDYTGKVSVAAHNASGSIVISGEKTLVGNILDTAEKRGVRISRLHVSHGFHSPLMEPILEDFRSIASEVNFNKPEVKFISSVTGKMIDENTILGADYWTPHIREKVDFYHSLLTLKAMEDLIFIEIGADRTLVSLSRMTLNENTPVVPSLNRKKSDWEQLSLSIGEIYAMGAAVDWEKVAPEGTRHWTRTSLPTYPFDRKEYWIQPVFEHSKALNAAGNRDLHPFIGQKITTPYLNDGVIYQSIFTAQIPYFMKEHIIFDTAISPAAAHVSMLLSASRQLYNPAGCMLENMEFRSPLLVENDGERSVQVLIENAGSGDAKFQIVSRDNRSDGSSWVKHCLGSIKGMEAVSGEDKEVSIEQLQNKYDASGFNFYEALRNFGFNLGEGFERITRVWKSSDNEGVCLVEPKEDIPGLDSYILYPGVIDSIFQSAISISELTNIMESKNEEGTVRTMIPFSISKLKYYYRPAQQFWCHTRADVQKEAIIADIDVYNEKGELIFSIERMAARLTDRNSLLKELTGSGRHMLYHVKWVEKQLKDKKIEIKGNERLVLFSDGGEMAAAIEKRLSRYGIEAVTVLESGQYGENSDGTYEICYESKDDFRRLFDSIASRHNCSEFTAVYFAGNSPGDGVPSAADLLSRQKRSCGGLLNMVQVLADLQISYKAGIWVVTEGVHDVGDAAAGMPLSACQGSLWGFAQTLRLEHSKLWRGIIDIAPGALQENEDAVLWEIIGGEDGQVALRQGAKRYVPRLVKDSEFNKADRKPDSKPLTVLQDATYVITGGTGAIGLIYADCLIRKGARHLVLTGRRGPNEDAQRAIGEFKEKGADIVVSQADICDEGDVEALFSKIRSEMPPVKGIIHAAGVIEDKMIPDQTWESFWKVLSVKAAGACNIHNALKNDEPDFFIMLSSIASIIGNMGQSNYSAANYFLNAFAHYRRSKNLPASTVCWGPWLGSGMAAKDAETMKRMSGQGIYGIQPENGARIIDKLFEENYTQVLAADVNWNLFSKEQEVREVLDFLSGVVSANDDKAAGQEKPEKESNILEDLKNLAPEARKTLLMGRMQESAGRIMGFPEGQLPSLDISLMEQGADSLMIFSMRNEVKKLTGQQLDVSLFFNYPSLRKLSAYLLTQVLFTGEQGEAESGAAQNTEDILSEINSLI